MSERVRAKERERECVCVCVCDTAKSIVEVQGEGCCRVRERRDYVSTYLRKTNGVKGIIAKNQ